MRESTFERPPLALVARLCSMLEDGKIPYCHWKSNNVLGRSASGDNDLDLLVSRSAAVKCGEVLSQLGFKPAEGRLEKEVPGVKDYYGYDPGAERLVHAHIHYQLVVGHDMTKNVRIPIEEAYLASAVQNGLFRVPAPHYEYVVFVIRMALKHLAWDAVLHGESKLKEAEHNEMEYLRTRSKMEDVDTVLSKYLPGIDGVLFRQCSLALETKVSTWRRVKDGLGVQRALQANTRYGLMDDAVRKLWRRWSLAVRKRIFRVPVRRRLSTGGVMVAIVGGDGAGKTTLVTRLHGWVAKDFDAMMVHMGKPPKSLTTMLIRAVLSVGTMLGLYPHLNAMTPYRADAKRSSSGGKYAWMLREACKARDRYATYLKARRYVNRGGIVISDRFPVAQIKLMDSPVIGRIAEGEKATRLARFLIEYERKCYERMALPEVVVVLRLDPDIAVQRKTSEDAAHVRARSTEIWEADWRGSGVHVVDGSLPRSEVLSSVKSLVWSRL